MPTTRAEPLELAARSMVWTLYGRCQHDNEGHDLTGIERYFVRRWQRAALTAADPAPAGAEPFRFLVESYDQRRREVAATIEEADAAADDGSAGPDALADALMEVAEGWVRAALQASADQEPPESGLRGDDGIEPRTDVGVVTVAMPEKRLLTLAIHSHQLAAAYDDPYHCDAGCVPAIAAEYARLHPRPTDSEAPE